MVEGSGAALAVELRGPGGPPDAGQEAGGARSSPSPCCAHTAAPAHVQTHAHSHTRSWALHARSRPGRPDPRVLGIREKEEFGPCGPSPGPWPQRVHGVPQVSSEGRETGPRPLAPRSGSQAPGTTGSRPSRSGVRGPRPGDEPRRYQRSPGTFLATRSPVD